MTTLLSVKFFLANPNVERTSINMIILSRGSRYKKGIGVSVDTKQWNPTTQRAVTGIKHKDGAQINFEIEKWRMAAERLFRNIFEQQIEVKDTKYLWQLLDCEMSGSPYVVAQNDAQLLTSYIQHVFIPRFLCSKSETRIRRFKVVLAKIKAFETATNRHYTLQEIDVKFYRDFQEYVLGLKHSVNYFGTLVKVIKQVMREAEQIDKLHISAEYKNPSFKSTSADVDSVYLTRDELSRIGAVQIDDTFIDALYPDSVTYGRQSLKRSYTIVRNRFLIGAFTGLRMSDFNKLKNEDIADGKITVITQKTSQRVVIPIHPIVQGIIDSGFDFSESLSEQKTRLYIKNLCRYAKVDQLVEVRENTGYQTTVKQAEKWTLVSSHTARRSFATNAYLAGIPPIAIMKITGHTSERTFMKYIRISQQENADMLASHSFFQQ